jgi:hypothetical protein
MINTFGGFLMVEDFNLGNFNMLGMNAKKVLIVLSELEQGLLAKGELIHKKTGLIPEEINDAVRSLKKSLKVDLADRLTSLSPYDFYAVEITDFGRQVVGKYG